MKKLFAIFMLFGALAMMVGCSDSGKSIQLEKPPQNVLELSKYVFECVKQGDNETFKSKLWMNLTDIRELFKNSNLPEDRKTQVIDSFSRTQSKLKKRLEGNPYIEMMRKALEHNKINPDTIMFSHINYKLEPDIGGIKFVGDVDIIINAEGKLYRLEMDSCYKTKDGWRVSELTPGGSWSLETESKRKERFKNWIWNEK